MALFIAIKDIPKRNVLRGDILSLEGSCKHNTIFLQTSGGTIPEWQTRRMIRTKAVLPYVRYHWARCPECDKMVELPKLAAEDLQYGKEVPCTLWGNSGCSGMLEAIE